MNKTLKRGARGRLRDSRKTSSQPGLASDEARTLRKSRLAEFFGTELFWRIVLGVFLFSALWIALFSLYPMAFDEEVHVGIIRAYSEVWSPFSLVQHPSYDVFGPVATDPSYLYHYLMSFPYRLLHVFTDNQTALVIMLRLINIGLFAAALVVFRRVLLGVRLSRAAAHTVLAVFVLIPVVPLLAAQVNYDNLIMLVAATLFLLALKIQQDLRDPKKHFPLGLLVVAVSLACLGTVVKYAFLPIAAGAALFVCVELILAMRKVGLTRFFRNIWAQYMRYSVPIRALLVVLVVASFGLFAERYVANAIDYGSPVPDCEKVLSVDRCMNWGPWRRNYELAALAPAEKIRSLPHYTLTHFAWGMWERLYFALAGPSTDYETRRGLVFPRYTGLTLTIVGIVLTLVFVRRMVREHPEYWLFVFASALYIAVLVLQVYGDYVQTGAPVAINGRYLLPLLPGLGAIAVTAYQYFFREVQKQSYQGVFTLVVLLLLLQGGGALTYIARSEPSWYWQTAWVQSVTQTARQTISPLLLGPRQ